VEEGVLKKRENCTGLRQHVPLGTRRLAAGERGELKVSLCAKKVLSTSFDCIFPTFSILIPSVVFMSIL